MLSMNSFLTMRVLNLNSRSVAWTSDSIDWIGAPKQLYEV